MENEQQAEDLTRAISRSRLSADAQIRCEHVADDGRTYGWHHHAGPHACDAADHGGQCPWWADLQAR